MNLAGAFFRLIRWPNLVFIAVTQCLFHFCVVKPSAYGSYYNFPLQLNTHLFFLLCLSSVLIAAGGYIINDYFDINIDLVNKPEKMVVDKYISRRWALLLHMLLSTAGIVLGFVVSWRLENWLIGLANFGCVLLLWYYSTTYKRRLLVGNVLISALTAWVILVLLVAELPGWWSGKLTTVIEKETVARLSRIGVLYAAFAFVLTIIREAIKDMEDLEGDRKEGCRTMPIVWGITASKVFTAVWMVVIIATITDTQVYVIQFGWWWSAIYIILFVVVPLLFIFRKLYHAHQSNHFSYLSRLVKMVMLSGILSMVFFLWYTR
jgi:4-hydroxybenzoate polyprenyltransferase